MFEGKPLFAPQGLDSAQESGPDAPLRELSWSDLRARLEAARDLQASMNAHQGHAPASFDAGFARRLADRPNGKDGINRTDLANGKGSCPKDGAAHDVAPSASRGNT